MSFYWSVLFPSFETLIINTMKKTLPFFLTITMVMVMLNLKAQVTASFNVSGNAQKCVGVAYTFNNTSTGATSYNWDFGDGNTSTATSPSISYTSSGTFIVTLTASDGVNTSTRRVAVYVNPAPSAYFNIAGYGDKYPGDLIEFENFSNNATSASWTFGDGATSIKYNPEHIYTTPGMKTITLTATNGCGSPAQYQYQLEIVDSVNVNPEAQANGTYLACPGEEVTFSHYSRFATSVKWDFGDGNSIVTQKEDVKYIYTNKGTYTVKLYAYRNVKVDSAEFNITITDTALYMPYSNMQPYRVINGNYKIANCVNAPFIFNGYPQAGQTAYWRLSNGIVLNKPDTNYAFNANGTYQAWYVVTNQCGAKDSTPYDLYVLPSDTFTSYPTSISVNPMMGYVCPGGKMKFTTWNSDNDATLLWKINDTLVSTEMNFEHVFGNYEGMHTVKLIRNRTCGNPDSTIRNVFTSNLANPTAEFSFSGTTSSNQPNCYKDTVKFTTTYYNNDYALNPVTHFWDFGDGTTSALSDPMKVYNSPGWHSVIHRTTNSCGISQNQATTIYTASDVAPLVRFYANPLRICANDSTMIDNFTMGADSMVIEYGDGQRKIVVGFDFPHQFHKYNAPGVYTAKVYAYNRCSGDTGQTKITVLAGPDSYILMSDTTVEPGTTLNFTKFTGNAVRHMWFRSSSLSDTTSSNSFSRTFSTAGVFKVYLLSYNEIGCSQLDSVTINVQVASALATIESEGASLRIYPNPTTDVYHFDLQLERQSQVEVTLFDLNGKKVATYYNGKLGQGEHNFVRNAADLPSGIYICYINVNGSVTHQKLVKQ
jgi:PKD repeat protein